MKIFVERVAFLGAHGVYAEEREQGRRFEVDLWIDLDATPASTASDQLDQTIDYRSLAQIVMDVAHGPSRSLVERMADEMIERALSLSAHVARAGVTIRKVATGVPGDPAFVGVELVRSRGA